jgi:hypothetical protein
MKIRLNFSWFIFVGIEMSLIGIGIDELTGHDLTIDRFKSLKSDKID